MAKIYIIGAGVSGLIAALELEKAGYSPVILEKGAGPGGRVITDRSTDSPMDHGFQVLLTSYPAVQEYLNLDALKLQKFLPGSAIIKKGNVRVIGDPLRNIGLFLPTLFSGIGTFSDKFKVFRLSLWVKRLSVEEIFEQRSVSTIEFLHNSGFSEGMIRDFFRPFFAGIFLEPQLETSHRMFLFVYKMFSEGHAAIPKKGMQAIPEQLADKLSKTEIHYNQEVKEAKAGQIQLADGRLLEADQIIWSGITNTSSWHSCINLYFEVEESKFNRPLIGLIPEKDALINNFHFLGDLWKGKQQILSVTIVGDPGLDDDSLVEKVQEELLHFANIKAEKCLKIYRIKKALPEIQDMRYAPSASELAIEEGIWKTGDFTSNPSLNAAMEAGKKVAETIIDHLR